MISVTFFILIFIMAIIAGFGTFLLPYQDDQIIFSIFAVILFCVLAIAAYDVVEVDVVPYDAAYEIITVNMSLGGVFPMVFYLPAIVCGLKGVALVLYALRHPENPFNHPITSGERHMDYHYKP